MATEVKQKQKWCKSCERKTLHVATVKTVDMGCGFLCANLFLCVITLGLWLPVALLLVGLGSFGNAIASAPYLCQVCGRKN